MKTYHAVLMHGSRGGEGRYSFEGPDDLFAQTPVRIMRHFMDTSQSMKSLGHIDYEINAAFKNMAAQTAVVIGEFHLPNDSTQPYMCMISPKDDQSE